MAVCVQNKTKVEIILKILKGGDSQTDEWGQTREERGGRLWE